MFFVVNQGVIVVPETRTIRFTLKNKKIWKFLLCIYHGSQPKLVLKHCKQGIQWFSSIQRSGLSRRAAPFDSRYNSDECGKVIRSSSWISKRIHSKTAKTTFSSIFVNLEVEFVPESCTIRCAVKFYRGCRKVSVHTLFELQGFKLIRSTWYSEGRFA